MHNSVQAASLDPKCVIKQANAESYRYAGPCQLFYHK